jgi:hypothetical protein
MKKFCTVGRPGLRLVLDPAEPLHPPEPSSGVCGMAGVSGCWTAQELQPLSATLICYIRPSMPSLGENGRTRISFGTDAIFTTLEMSEVADALGLDQPDDTA